MRDVWSDARPLSEAGYAEMRAAFTWAVPRHFNFGSDVIDRRARHRDGPALIWADAGGAERTLTYGDLARATNRLGNVLRRHGIAQGDRILVMLPRLPEWMVALIGTLKIGAVAIPCIEMLTDRDLAYRVRDAGVRAVICRAEHASKFDALAGAIPVRIAIGAAATGLGGGWLDYAAEMEGAPEALEPAVVAAEDPAMMYYTSGSTGHPKGVLHAARALYAWRVSALYWLDLRPGERIWCTADTGWSKAGTSILFGPLSCGATSFFYDGPFVPGERLRLLARHRVTVYCAPATELFRIVDEDVRAHDLTALRRVVSAGEAMNPAVAERWEAVTGVRVDEAYGQTETLMVVLNYPGEPVKYGSMGRPAPGSDLAVLDAEGRRLPDGEEGTLALRAPNPQLMLGYWQEEERTAAAFVDGPEGRWYLTGDRASIDADGYFWYRGRADDVINSAGYRIGPLEVENALLEHAAVQACAVVGSPDAKRGEIVKAFVVLRQGHAGSDALVRELQDHVKRVTAPYKYPRAISFIAALPLTVTGKIRRRDLRDREYADRDGASGA